MFTARHFCLLAKHHEAPLLQLYAVNAQVFITPGLVILRRTNKMPENILHLYNKIKSGNAEIQEKMTVKLSGWTYGMKVTPYV